MIHISWLYTVWIILISWRLFVHYSTGKIHHFSVHICHACYKTMTALMSTVTILRPNSYLFTCGLYHLMAVDITVHWTRIGLHFTRHFKVRGIDHFSSFELLLMLSMLLLRSGDIEMNPGPDLSLSDSRDTDISYLSSSVDSIDYEAIINGNQ